MVGQLNVCPHFFVFLLYIFFFKSIVAYRWCVIYVREYNDFNVTMIITRPIWTTWTPMSSVPEKAFKLNRSLTPGDWEFEVKSESCKIHGPSEDVL